ncbi:MAG: prepilin-type N-terminal cleavage/methylation domain-containing protein [Deltaproteobacteria bacterium]|nr:prepilin-type N-terminal cleavage/methylation domain-containing protein [Deltaproteobacteria bacterium]
MKKTNSFGFTIVEILIAIGIMTVVALGTATMVQFVTKSSKNAQSNLEFQNLSGLLRNFLSKTENCSNIFNVTPKLEFDPTSASSTIFLNEIRAQSAGSILAKKDTDITPGLRLTVLDVRNFHVTAAPDVFLADIHIEAVKSDSFFIGTKMLSANIGIQLNTQVSGAKRAVLSCELYQGPTTQQTCQNLGGIFDASAIPPCKFPNNALTIQQICNSITGATFNGATNICTVANGSTITAKTCNSGEVANGISSNGLLNCANLSFLSYCPTGQVARGVSANGGLICITLTCPNGQLAQSYDPATGAPRCVITQCQSGKYLRGFDSVGNIICDALPPSTGQAACTLGPISAPGGIVVQAGTNISKYCQNGAISYPHNGSAGYTDYRCPNNDMIVTACTNICSNVTYAAPANCGPNEVCILPSTCQAGTAALWYFSNLTFACNCNSINGPCSPYTITKCRITP